MRIVCLLFICFLFNATYAACENGITVIVDAFGIVNSPLQKDWGYAALIEYEAKRVLFDTGNNAEIFEANVKALKIDLSRLDAVVISHRHGDHTAGLHYLKTVHPNVKVYVPDDEYFGGPTPRQFYLRKEESLPKEMRYFGGEEPENVPHGSAWRGFQFIRVHEPVEILPGMHLIPGVSMAKETMELKELSLSLETPQGAVVVAGCSHPGILNIVQSAVPADSRIHLVTGGFHLVSTPDMDIEQIANELRDRWNVQQIAPGHCTGEPAFAAIKKIFGDRYVYAGVGTVLRLPTRKTSRLCVDPTARS